ncbi:MAG: pilus assembly protein PilM [Candidatus Omnitrophota bacterium]|nr:MAG: pilus assembly protein PilM [Candidatus Omnitrophota bacterium]
MFKKNLIIGVDIGTSSVKTAQFIRKQDGFYLIRAGWEELPSASGEAEKIAALKKLLKGVNTAESKIIVSLNCPLTTSKIITTPHMPQKELYDSIKLNAKNYFSFSLKDAVIDFKILKEITQGGVKKYQVLIAVSPKTTVDRYLSFMNKLNIKPAAFIPSCLGLGKAVEKYSPKEKEINAFLEIGKSISEISIYKEKNFIFSRKIPVAGDDFTKALTGMLVSERGKIKLSDGEAEQIKRHVGLPCADEPKMINDRVSTTQILSMLHLPLEHLVGEIKRCLDYSRKEANGVKIDTLVLCGGGAYLKGLGEFLSEELAIEVITGFPFEGLKRAGIDAEKTEEISLRLIPSIGAALSEDRDINLLPEEIKQQLKRTVRRTTVEAVTAAVILLLIFIYTGLKIQHINFQKKAAAFKLELKSLGLQFRQVKAQNIISVLLSAEPYWEEVFKELSNIIPSNIRLTELTMREKILKIRGVVISSEPEVSLSNFMLILEDSMFRNVNLITTRRMKKEEQTSEFELECEFK